MPPKRPLRVVVVGGGFAAAELVLALDALAEDRVAVELISPSTELAFRPAATGTPFELSHVDRYDLASLVHEAGARLRRDSVEAVAPRVRRVRLRSGVAVEYDALVLSVGARARAAIPGAVTFRDQRDAHLIAGLVGELQTRGGRRVAFAAPSGVSWTLPLYELALLTAAEIERRDLGVETTLITPEAAPLQAFGPGVSDHIGTLLAERGIRRLRGVAHSVGRGRMTLTSGEAVHADRVVAVPRLVGRRVAGVPADWNGFVATDHHGRVHDLPGVFAAGDMTQFRVKQGGIATQQADVIAAVIAAWSGADVEIPPVRHVLRTRLFVPDGPLYLRAELDGDGRPLPATETPQVSTEALWRPNSFAVDGRPRAGGGVKRAVELAPLSRDHHVALEHALRLRRASEDDVADIAAAFLAFLVTDGRAHFAQEEELLAPQVPDDHADLAARMVAEHDEVLRRAEALGRCPDVASARGLGELLGRHVRFEERELFPLLERRLPAPRMHELGRELTRVRVPGRA